MLHPSHDMALSILPILKDNQIKDNQSMENHQEELAKILGLGNEASWAEIYVEIGRLKENKSLTNVQSIPDIE